MGPANDAYQHVNSRGVTYFLNCKDVVLRGGHQRVIYYFTKEERPETACDLPGGMEVVENEMNGFLVLRKVAR